MGCCIQKNEDRESLDSYHDFKCPDCHRKGVKVALTTVQSFVKIVAIDKGITYKFCKNTDCSIVYFTANKEDFFRTCDISTKITLKDPGLDVKLCYCFNHTRQSVQAQIQSFGKTSVLEDIKMKMKEPGCFCETSNPQGGCCLGNVKAWIKTIKEL